jgi:hypothetical protein
MVDVFTAPGTLREIVDFEEPPPHINCTGFTNLMLKFFTIARNAAICFTSHDKYVDSEYHFTPDHIYKIMDAYDGLLKLQPYNYTTIQPYNHTTIQPYNHTTIRPGDTKDLAGHKYHHKNVRRLTLLCFCSTCHLGTCDRIRHIS